MTTSEPSTPTGGSAYAEFVKDAVATEAQRRESIENRARAVVTLSGTLVTLLLALSSLITKMESYQLPVAARWLTLVAAIVFTLSALAAIGTAMPQTERVIDPAALTRSLPPRWHWSEDSALKKITATRLLQLTAIQRANAIKSTLLLVSVATQVVAIALLAAAASVVLAAGR